MRPDASTNTSVIPTVLTVFAVALGAVIGVEAGRDPLMLYLLTTPFAIILVWMARGVVGPDATRSRREPPTPARAVGPERGIPAMVPIRKS